MGDMGHGQQMGDMGHRQQMGTMGHGQQMGDMGQWDMGNKWETWWERLHQKWMGIGNGHSSKRQRRSVMKLTCPQLRLIIEGPTFSLFLTMLSGSSLFQRADTITLA